MSLARGQQRVGEQGPGGPSQPQKNGRLRGKEEKEKRDFFRSWRPCLERERTNADREGADRRNRTNRYGKSRQNGPESRGTKRTRAKYGSNSGTTRNGDEKLERERKRERAGEAEKCLGRIGTRSLSQTCGGKKGGARGRMSSLSAQLLSNTTATQPGEHGERSGYDGQR